jgi:DNA-binding transcriptional LysR family regulator
MKPALYGGRLFYNSILPQRLHFVFGKKCDVAYQLRMDHASENENVFSQQSFSYSRLDSLLLFAGAKSVTAAANKKNTSASSISRGIKELEDFFGCKLRQNIGRTATLSLEGEELVLLIRRQLEELKNFRDKHAARLHSVSLIAGDSLIHLLLLPKLADFQEKYERTTFVVSAGGTFEIVQALQNFAADLGILRKDAVSQKRSLEYTELGEYEYAIFVPKKLCQNGAVRKEQISSLRFALIKDHWDIDFIQSAKKDGISLPAASIFCETFTHVFRLVRLGKHAGILPKFCKLLLRDTIQFTPESFSELKQTMVLAWNPTMLETKKRLGPFTESLARELKDSIALMSLAD